MYSMEENLLFTNREQKVRHTAWSLVKKGCFQAYAVIDPSLSHYKRRFSEQ